jgi:hypothetical protein
MSALLRPKLFHTVDLSPAHLAEEKDASVLATLQLLSTASDPGTGLARGVRTLHLPRSNYYKKHGYEASLNAIRQTKLLHSLHCPVPPYNNLTGQRRFVEALRCLDSPLRELDVGKWDELDIPISQPLSSKLECISCLDWNNFDSR